VVSITVAPSAKEEEEKSFNKAGAIYECD